MENDRFVFIVFHKTWSASEIVGIYDCIDKAKKVANDKEATKTRSDGYIEYYVESCKLQ